MAQPQIFVSHSNVDTSFATRLVDDLNAAGANAWLDKKDLGAGDFQAGINQALEACDWFLLVLTENALKSRWVKQELAAANRLKNLGRIKDLIFVRAAALSQDALPPLYGVYNVFDATSDYDGVLARVVQEIGLRKPTDSSLPSGTYQDLKNRALKLKQAKRYADAIPYLQSATRFPYAAAGIWGELAYLYRECGCWDETIQAADKALGLNDELAWVWHIKADALIALERYSQAVECYEQGISRGLPIDGYRQQNLDRARHMIGLK